MQNGQWNNSEIYDICPLVLATILDVHMIIFTSDNRILDLNKGKGRTKCLLSRIMVPGKEHYDPVFVRESAGPSRTVTQPERPSMDTHRQSTVPSPANSLPGKEHYDTAFENESAGPSRTVTQPERPSMDTHCESIMSSCIYGMYDIYCKYENW